MSNITVTVLSRDDETVDDTVRRAWALLTERMERREREKYAALRLAIPGELHEFDPSFDSGLEAY